MLRWADLGIPAAEVDERLPVGGRRRCDLREERGEVLLRKSLETPGRLAH